LAKDLLSLETVPCFSMFSAKLGLFKSQIGSLKGPEGPNPRNGDTKWFNQKIMGVENQEP